jgi:hypothetical protein
MTDLIRDREDMSGGDEFMTHQTSEGGVMAGNSDDFEAAAQQQLKVAIKDLQRLLEHPTWISSLPSKVADSLKKNADLLHTSEGHVDNADQQIHRWQEAHIRVRRAQQKKAVESILAVLGRLLPDKMITAGADSPHQQLCLAYNKLALRVDALANVDEDSTLVVLGEDRSSYYASWVSHSLESLRSRADSPLPRSSTASTTTASAAGSSSMNLQG